MKTIKQITLNRLHELILETESNNENVLVFDNFDEPNEYIEKTNHQVKFEFNVSIFILKGTLTAQIGHEEVTLKSHDWINILNGKIYETISISNDAKVAVICVHNGLFNLNQNIYKTLDFYNTLLKDPVISLSDDNVREYLNAYKHLKKYQEDNDNQCREELQKSFCNVIFLILCSELMKRDITEKQRSNRKEAIYQSFLQNIEKHYRNERSVKFYANKLCLTPKYLSSVIHQMSGKHASEWLDDFIIREIKAMLKTTTMPVQQIAYELNFSTPAHFGKFFKRITGVSPQRYRHTSTS